LEWMLPKNVLEFILVNKVYDDIFGHVELIKRSIPLVRFLYQQGHLTDIVSLLKMVEGKHEVWASMLYKVLNDLAEVIQEKDIVLLLDEISTIKEVD
jgi:hypothetical protein